MEITHFRVRSFLFLLTLIVLAFQQLYAQDRFEHFETTQGLSNNSVRYISQDNIGYLWFSTMNGINQYDGKKFRHYVNNPNDSTSIYSNRILQSYTDLKGNTWFIGYDRRVNFFDRDNNSFIHTNFNVRRVKNTQTQAYILESSPGILWFNDANGGVQKLMTSKNNTIITDYTNFENQLNTNDVNIITRDSNGKIWIGTQIGLFMIPSDTLPLQSKYIKQLWKEKKVPITAITESKKEIWVGTKQNGIYIIDINNDIVTTHPLNELFSHSSILNISVNDANDWLISTDDQGYFLIKQDHSFQQFSESKIGWHSTDYFETYVDRKGNFWLQSRKNGVTLIDPLNNSFKHFPLRKDLRISVEEDESLFFLEDHNNNLWVGTYGSGLFRYEPEKKEFINYIHEENNPSSISSNFILSLFEDASQNLWIGTRNGGVNKLLLEKSNFHNYNPAPNSDVKLNSEVRAIAEDEQNRIWIGTKTGVLQCLDKNLNIIASLDNHWLYENDFDLAGIYHLFFDSKGNLWVSTKGNGIYIFKDISNKPNQSIFKNLNIKHLHQKSKPAISSNYVYSVCEDKYGQYWVATYLGGINKITEVNDEYNISFYRNTSKTPNKLTDNRARCTLSDAKGNIWVGTGNGLNLITADQLQLDDPEIIKIVSDAKIPNSISYNDILYIHEDNRHQIWLGTFGGGLNKLLSLNSKMKTTSWEHIDIDRQINDNTVYSVISDKNDQIWMATDQGICKLYPKTKKIDNFFLSDVIGRNSFSEAGCLFTHGNKIIFGHTNGLVAFSPDSIVKDTRQFPLVINSFYLYNELISPGENSPLTQAIENTESITLEYDQNFIGFEFAVLDYRSPNKLSYFYQLQNYEDTWNEASNNSAFYKNLKPGKYIFKVRSSNISGLPNDRIKTIKIHIKKPLYATTVALLIYIAIAFAIVLLIMYYASKELQMKAKVELEREMTQNKLQFYTNISHELKTPLTLQLGTIEKIISNTNPGSSNLLDLFQVKRNAHRLLNLVEQLIDFRKIQNKAYKLNYQNVNLLLFFEEIYEAFKPLASHKKINFQFTHEGIDQQGGIDQDSIERVIFNLLSNAFKNTKSGKKVILSVKNAKKHLEIFVIDEGIGIPQQNLPYIFNQFTSGNKNNLVGESNSGIGLSFTKEIIKLMKGTISVESEEDKGSKFHLRIPLVNADQTNSDPHLKRRSQFEFIHSELLHTKTSEKQIAKPRTEKGRILIVDDNDEVRQMLKEQISSFYTSEEATNGMEALELLKEDQNFDLILTDLVMPRLDGIEFTKKVRSNHITAHIPVILLTALTGEENNLESIKAGADDFIAKPYHPVILMNKIESLIKQRKTLKQIYNSDSDLKSNDSQKTETKNSFVEKITKAIESNISQQDFNIDVLSNELGIGRSVFYKKVKQHTGKTPNEFIKNIKMRKAAEILRSTEKNISQVAYEVGYNDIGYFRKCFKDYFGETPQAYQQKFKDF